SKVKKEYALRGYKTERCGNLYAFTVERCFRILHDAGYFSVIVQLPIVCTDRMIPVQNLCLDCSSFLWFANFDDRPARLFDGLEHIRASIFLSKKGKHKTQDTHIFSTTYNRWYSEIRSSLFNLLSFAIISELLTKGAIPKIGHSIATSIMKRIRLFKPLRNYLGMNSLFEIYFHNAPQYWVRAMDFTPYFWNERNGVQVSSHIKSLRLSSELDALAIVASLNSSIFYWWFIILSNCRDLNMREIENFPIGISEMKEPIKHRLSELTEKLMSDLKQHAQRKECFYKTTGEVKYDEFSPKYSKPIIDKIDQVLAKHYSFTDEELDFIINYDIKYRMGLS
ncbi:MAG: SAM-dependent methyltransferase, partial [Thermotogota bacterium]|nr:SAM-dependent methyltransferase [Thermotogota bacterium]